MGSVPEMPRCDWALGYEYALYLHAQGRLERMVRYYGPFKVRVKAVSQKAQS